MQEKLKNLSLRMILSITDSKTELKLHTLLDEAGIPMRFQFRGLGTASSEVLQVCGLGESDRLLTFWVLPKNMVHRLFAKMNEALCLKKTRTGNCRQYSASRSTGKYGAFHYRTKKQSYR